MEKNNYKKAARLYFICAFCFYIVSIIHKFRDSMGITYLCLGSTFLCLGSVYLNKSKEEDSEDNENIEDNEGEKDNEYGENKEDNKNNEDKKGEENK